MGRKKKEESKSTEITKGKGKGGLPMISTFESVLNSYSNPDDLPNEKDYLAAKDQYLPFSTALRADQYIKLKRLEYWGRTPIKTILENMLEIAFEQFPESKKELPESERAKLKQLKTAKDYYRTRDIQALGRSLSENNVQVPNTQLGKGKSRKEPETDGDES